MYVCKYCHCEVEVSEWSRYRNIDAYSVEAIVDVPSWVIKISDLKKTIYREIICECPCHNRTSKDFAAIWNEVREV